MIIRILIVLLSTCLADGLLSQECNPYFDKAYSPRIANYDIKLSLDHESKMVDATQQLKWINSSPVAVDEIRMYLYVNAFKNTKSSYLRDSNSRFGNDLSSKPAEGWGWVDILSMKEQRGQDLTDKLHFVQPDDGNKDDQTVLNIPLSTPLMAGDTLVLNLDWKMKMPETISRCGYSKADFFMFSHWFPQAGVFEQDRAGEWGWNCHQFLQGTEFYSDFGNYDVEITASQHLVIGGSGCKIKEEKNDDGTQTIAFHIEDVIDFAWAAYPFFDIVEDQWEHVSIKLMITEEHCMFGDRLISAAKSSLAWLDEHIGPYPYTTLTIMDPPLHGLRSGFMEYPTFITGGSFAYFPEGVRTLEGLIVHEFCHQYYMGMLASNEKEEPWLDEGFVTYVEGRIMDATYGEKKSLFDIFGYQLGKREMSRVEYTGLRDPAVGTLSRPGWEIKQDYKELIYRKTATVLETLRGMVGDLVMNDIMKTYFERFKFKHPRGEDFIATANEVVSKHHGDKFGDNLDWFFEQTVYGTAICDYAVSGVYFSGDNGEYGMFGDSSQKEYKAIDNGERMIRVRVERLGDMIIPVDVKFVTFEGEEIIKQWDGKAKVKYFDFEKSQRMRSVHIDPEQKIYMDIDLNNNSITVDPERSALYKYGAKALYWVQNALHTVGMFI